MNKGFTLIEIIVVVGIMTMLSGFMIVYTRGSENQIKILKDKASFISALYRARSLALRTFVSSDVKVCGYGLHIVDQNHFVLWRDLSSSLDCSGANRVYDNSENIEDPIALSKGIVFTNHGDANFLKTILFIPPNPDVISSPDLLPGQKFKIVIGTQDGKSLAVLGVTKLGQAENAIGY